MGSNTNKQLRIQAFRDKLEIKLRKMKLALALLVLVFTITITVSERQAKIRGGGRIAGFRDMGAKNGEEAKDARALRLKHPSQFKSSDGQDLTRFPSRFVSVPGVASSDW